MNVGYRALAVRDDVQGARVPVHVLYPTEAMARTETFGRYEIDVATDAPVAGERLPLVAVSHGTGGTPWGYRGLATHLARAGFAVALVEHPGNSRADNSLENTPRTSRTARGTCASRWTPRSPMRPSARTSRPAPP